MGSDLVPPSSIESSTMSPTKGKDHGKHITHGGRDLRSSNCKILGEKLDGQKDTKNAKYRMGNWESNDFQLKGCSSIL